MFPLFWLFELKSWTYPNPFPYSFGGNAHAFISAMNPLHIWVTAFNDGIVHITDIQCTYSTTITTEREIELFEPYTGDSSKAPRYSVEYKTRTDEHISVVVTQTEYDGTVTQKTVDVRLVDDELKVDIQ